MCSRQDIDRAVKAFNKYPPRARGRMPAVLDSIYHAIVGLREARQAKWEPELMTYWYRDLGRALEQWRIAREEVEEDEREQLVLDHEEYQR